MRTPASQFLFGFLISFAPAPLVGFATYAVVHHKEPAPVEVVRPVEYGAPLSPAESPVIEQVVEDPAVPEPPQEATPPQEEEFEITRARGSSGKQQEIPKRKKPPGLPDF